MRLTFTFPTRSSDYGGKHGSARTSLRLPDTVGRLPEFKERVITLGKLIAEFSHVPVEISCRRVGIVDHLIASGDGEMSAPTSLVANTIIKMETYAFFRPEKVLLRFPAPSLLPIPFTEPATLDLRNPASDAYFMREFQAQTTEQQKYIDAIFAIANACLSLLNAEPPNENGHMWTFTGFHPHWEEPSTRKLVNEPKPPSSAHMHSGLKGAVVRALGTTQSLAPKPVRRYWAAPGVFKGVSMRSQSEIRCAAELEKRGIRWLYEYERLGPPQYLVDFFLPELGAWIEVKYSDLDARDEFQLPVVADYLASERGQRLFLFSNRSCYRISSEGFAPLDFKTFWTEIVLG